MGALERIDHDKRVVCGGMGVDISGWKLAGEVARLGGVGTISATGQGDVLARRLTQLRRDPDNHELQLVKDSLETFPNPSMVDRVLDKYHEHVSSEDTGERRYRPTQQPRIGALEAEMLQVLGTYVQADLAKRRAGGRGLVAVNTLGKIPRMVAPSAIGAILAGADVFVQGAGVPDQVPQLLTDLTVTGGGRYRMDVAGLPDVYQEYSMERYNLDGVPVARPEAWGIVSRTDVAKRLAQVGIEALVIESAQAGGHNAPTSGPEAPLAEYLEFGLPCIVAGGVAQKGLSAIQAEGGEAIQIGSLFALSNESGMDPMLRARTLRGIINQKQPLQVRQDEHISPTGFPFQVAEVAGTVSQAEVLQERSRVCDLAFLTQGYKKKDGSIGYRCPAEPIEQFERKIASPILARNIGERACLCNNLFAAAGLAQRRGEYEEPALVTLGSTVEADVMAVARAYKLPITAAKVFEFVRR